MAKKKTAKVKQCNCVQLVIDALKPTNTELVYNPRIASDMTFKGWAVYVETRKRDSKNREPKMSIACTFCPWCGKRILDEEEPDHA